MAGRHRAAALRLACSRARRAGGSSRARGCRSARSWLAARARGLPRLLSAHRARLPGRPRRRYRHRHPLRHRPAPLPRGGVAQPRRAGRGDAGGPAADPAPARGGHPVPPRPRRCGLRGGDARSFGDTPHRVALLDRGVERTFWWVQDYLKAGASGRGQTSSCRAGSSRGARRPGRPSSRCWPASPGRIESCARGCPGKAGICSSRGTRATRDGWCCSTAAPRSRTGRRPSRRGSSSTCSPWSSAPTGRSTSAAWRPTSTTSSRSCPGDVALVSVPVSGDLAVARAAVDALLARFAGREPESLVELRDQLSPPDADPVRARQTLERARRQQAEWQLGVDPTLPGRMRSLVAGGAPRAETASPPPASCVSWRRTPPRSGTGSTRRSRPGSSPVVGPPTSTSSRASSAAARGHPSADPREDRRAGSRRLPRRPRPRLPGRPRRRARLARNQLRQRARRGPADLRAPLRAGRGGGPGLPRNRSPASRGDTRSSRSTPSRS